MSVKGPAAGDARVLYVVNAASGEMRAFVPRLRDVGDMSLAPEDREVVYASGDPKPEFWVVSGLTSQTPTTSPAPSVR